MNAVRQVFFFCNGRGVLPVAVAVYSLLKSADPSRPLGVYVAHDAEFARRGGGDRLRDVVGRFPFATLSLFDITATLDEHPVLRDAKWPPIAWAWAFSTQIFPDLTGNLVIIDWDMFVLKDLAELYELDLEGRGMISAAVSESRREDRPALVAAGWPEAAGFSVNTGLQVLNTDAFRRENTLQRMLAWYAAHKAAAECVEQDAANVVYGDRILRLHLRYNFTVGWFDRLPNHNPFARIWRVYPTRMVFEACADPAILHFIGHRKPWQRNHRAFRNVYRRAMVELGLYDPKAYGERPLDAVVGLFFDVYNAAAALYARLALKLFYRDAACETVSRNAR